MKTRGEFLRALTGRELSVADRAIALLWYYRETQEFEERTGSELANDLHEERFARPNVTRLDESLRQSPQTNRGRRDGTFQIALKAQAELDDQYRELLHDAPTLQIQGLLLPSDLTAGTRVYIEKLAYQINVTYENGLYDASAVLCRRLMESLIIEVYANLKRQHDIQNADGAFFPLDRLIAYISNDRAIALGRNSGGTMGSVKLVGDTAAHDRYYITKQVDIDDWKARYRRLIEELLHLSGIK